MGVVKPKTAGTRKQPEAALQRKAVAYLREKQLLHQGSAVGAVLAGDPKRRAMQMSAMKAKGCYTGFPDLIIFAPGADGTHALTVELKVGRNSLTAEQGIWKEKLLEAGYAHAVVYTLEEFTAVVEAHVHGAG